MTDQPNAAERAEPVRLRQGRKVGRTLYVQVGSEPSDSDPLVGVMDTREMAARIVANEVEVRTLRARVHDLEVASSIGLRMANEEREKREQAESALASEREKMARYEHALQRGYDQLASTHAEIGHFSYGGEVTCWWCNVGELLDTTNEGAPS